MIIICENCTAKFNLDESLLSPNGSKVRCSQCSHLFLAFPKGDGPEKIIPSSMEVEKPRPDNRVDGDPQIPGDKYVQTEPEPPLPFQEDSPETDEINFDADLDIDFPEDDFDFDEPDLDLNFDLDLDEPQKDDSGNRDHDTLTKMPTTPHETEDDFDLGLDLDLDMDMDFELDEPETDDSGSREHDTLTKIPTTTHETEDNFDLGLDLDLDMDMEFELDEPKTDDSDSREHDTLTEKAITPHEIEDDFDLELDLDLELDMELELDEPETDNSGSREHDTLTEETITPHETEDDFNLELDFNEDLMPPASDKTNKTTSPSLSTDNKDLPLIQEQEKSTTQSDVEKKNISKEPGDDIPISPNSLTQPLPLSPSPDMENRSSSIVKLFSLFILLIILLLGTHAASLMTGITIPFVSDLKIPFLTEFVTQKPPPPPPVRLAPDKKSVNGRFETNQKEGTLFVITGNVHNTSKFTCSNIKVTGALLNTEKVNIKSKTVVCGITIPAQQLATLDLPAINKLLNNSGQQSSPSVAPGKVSPFMIVFSKLPDNLENFTVTVDNFDKK